jgi:alkylation response protein AidB-like acyl-CoA dehydrogenase
MLDANDAYISQCVRRLNAGTLTSANAAKAKLWSTELRVQVTMRCLQLFGGYGYMMEYPIARLHRQPGTDNLRRHERDHERAHRPGPAGLTGAEISSLGEWVLLVQMRSCPR